MVGPDSLNADSQSIDALSHARKNVIEILHRHDASIREHVVEQDLHTFVMYQTDGLLGGKNVATVMLHYGLNIKKQEKQLSEIMLKCNTQLMPETRENILRQFSNAFPDAKSMIVDAFPIGITVPKPRHPTEVVGFVDERAVSLAKALQDLFLRDYDLQTVCVAKYAATSYALISIRKAGFLGGAYVRVLLLAKPELDRKPSTQSSTFAVAIIRYEIINASLFSHTQEIERLITHFYPSVKPVQCGGLSRPYDFL